MQAKNSLHHRQHQIAMSINEKYAQIRPEITDGCLFLMSKPKMLSKIIRWVDNSEFSHVGLVFTKAGRNFIIDSNANGVHPELLSVRVNECDNFCIIKPLCDAETIEDNLVNSFKRAETGINYDFSNGIKESINRKFGTKFKITLRDMHDICSDWVEQTAINQKMVTNLPLLPFPQDYLRYRSNFTILLGKK